MVKHRGVSRSRSKNAGSRGHSSHYYANNSPWYHKIGSVVHEFLYPFTMNHRTTLVKNDDGGSDELYDGRIMFWGDKALLFVDFFQLLGLYWNAANPWPLPYPWVSWTRWWTAFNLDVFSLLPTGALAGRTGNTAISKWGSFQNGYLTYFFLPFVLVTAAIVALYWYFDVNIATRYGERYDRYRPSVMKVTLHLLNFLYLPTGLVALRGMYCYENVNPGDPEYYGQYVMAADEKQVCWQGMHLFCFFLVLFLYAPIFLYLPKFVYDQISACLVYMHPADHEKRLQAWEIAQMLRIDTEFADRQMWLFASHMRPAAFYRVWMFGYKAVMLLLYAFCRGNGNGDDNSLKVQQAALIWGATAVFSLRFLFFNGGKMPFRITSTNIVFVVFCTIMVGNTTLGLCNAYGVLNVVTVNSRQTLLLSALNFGGYFIMLIVLLLVCVNPYALWPSVRTIHRIESNPVFYQMARRWMFVFERANAIKQDIMSHPNETIDALGLVKCIRDLRSCWLTARHHGSLFELLFSELIEECSIIYASREPHLARLNTDWDTAYQESLKSGVFAKRNDHYRLMAPRKKRVLTKLLAMRIMQQRDPEVDEDMWKAMTDREMQQALRQVVILERRTRQLLERGKEFELARQHQRHALVDEARADGDQDTAVRAGTSGAFIANVAEIEHMSDIEESLYRWENIIDTIEEYQYEHPFTRRLFTMDRMEDWYSYRTVLIEQLSELREFFDLNEGGDIAADADYHNDNTAYGDNMVLH